MIRSLIAIYLTLISVDCYADFSMFKGLDRSKLEQCQKDFIEKVETTPHKFSILTALNPAVLAGKVGYSNLSPYDMFYINKHSLDLFAIRRVKRLSVAFVHQVCGSQIDQTMSNSVLHFAMNLFLYDQLGYQKACEFSTGHEAFVDIKSRGLLTMETTTGPLKMEHMTKMDLHNNAMGLRYARTNGQLVKQCANYLETRADTIASLEVRAHVFSKKEKKQQKYIKMFFDKELKRNLQKYGDPADVKNSCFKIFIDAQNDSEYKLKYIDGFRGNCQKRMPKELDHRRNWKPQPVDLDDPSAGF